MDRSIVFVLVFIIVTSVAYYMWQESEAEKVLATTAEKQVEVPAKDTKKMAPAPEIRYPVPDPDPEVQQPVESSDPPKPVVQPDPLPSLDESDAALKLRLQRHHPLEKLESLFLPREMIRHFVVTVDNLDGRKLARRYSIVRSPLTTFIVDKTGNADEFLLAPANHDRYRPYMKFLEAVSDRQLLSIYVRFYPLFQEAYEELGYPDRYFNDRLIEIMDHLLATPVIEGEIRLTRPKVYYQFADSKLENLTAGQKILVRIGNDNAKIVRDRLTSLRTLLTTLGTG